MRPYLGRWYGSRGDPISTAGTETLLFSLQEFHLTLQAMADAVEGVAKHPSITYAAQPGVTSALVGQLAWLLGTAVGFAQKTLSKADVAAVFLSRKILLDRISLEGGLLKPPASFSRLRPPDSRTWH